MGDYNLPLSSYPNHKISDKLQDPLAAELRSFTELRMMICKWHSGDQTIAKKSKLVTDRSLSLAVVQ
jgi:hypothetical protein